MKKTIKQIVGIDVAQKELVVCFGKMYDDWTIEFPSQTAFPNTAKGFVQLLNWSKKINNNETELCYVCEATGVYHESAVYFLTAQQCKVSVVLPNKISSYIRTLDLKTVTDKTAAEAITRFGLERKLEVWVKPNELYKNVKHLTRERDQIVCERTSVKNQLHAEKAQAEPYKPSMVRLEKRIALLNKQEKEILKELNQLIKTDEKVAEKVKLITTIPGIGILTAATVLAETNGFELIRNKRQLASYAGFDVKEKLSGTSVKGKPRISKRGNTFLRKAMHLPALSAIKNETQYRYIFARLVSKHGIKMKAAVAVQRKLLEMTYTIFKKGEAYKSPIVKAETDIEMNEVELKLESELI